MHSTFTYRLTHFKEFTERKETTLKQEEIFNLLFFLNDNFT